MRSHDPFLIFAKNYDFKIFTTKKLRGQNLIIVFSGFNQKRVMRLFQILMHFYSYFLGISSKIGGRGGNMDFFEPEIMSFSVKFWSIATQKKFQIQKFFFL